MPSSIDLDSLAKGLMAAVSEAGTHLMEMAANGQFVDAHDISVHHGHCGSSVDVIAETLLANAIQKHMPDFSGKVLTEEALARGEFTNASEDVILCDELEGTTPFKRFAAQDQDMLPWLPPSFVCAAHGTGTHLGDIDCAAFYSLAANTSYLAIQVSGKWYSFMADIDGRRIVEPSTLKRYGDSKYRVQVVGYSNSFRSRKAQLEEALIEAGMSVYEGTPPSTNGILDVCNGRYDCYLDLRALWSRKKDGIEQEAMLQAYDIAAAVPFAMGCDMSVTDHLGNLWNNYLCNNAIPLVVSRPELHATVLEAIKPLLSQW